MESLDPICDKIGLRQLDDVSFLNEHCKKVNMAPRHLSLFIIFIIAVLMILEFGSQILCEMIGFLYPTYMSFKAIESHKVDDDQQWLTYWVVYCFISILDMSLGFLLEKIPFYQLIKLAVYVCMFHPNIKGAQWIYRGFIRKALLKYEVLIDTQINSFGNNFEKQANIMKDNVGQFAGDVAQEVAHNQIGKQTEQIMNNFK